MATIKSYTDLEQSRKLAEILPLESADMFYINGDIDKIIIRKWKDEMHDEDDLPCWSLTALLNILPSATLDSSNNHHYRLYCMERYTEWYDNAIDACYEMIIKLKKLNLI